MITKAKVKWFDKKSGKGSITTSEGGFYILNACNIKGAKTGFNHTACVYYTEGQEIEIELTGDVYIAGPCGPKGLTQGFFDSVQWSKLDHNSLAFKKNDKGEFTNGLFAEGKTK